MAHQRDGADDAAQPAKRFGRRTTLKLIGVGVSGAVARAAGLTDQAPHGSTHQATAPGAHRARAWRLRPLATGSTPQVLSSSEIATLGAVVDRIIPETDTPGARTAGVHWYLDDVCRGDSRLRDSLRNGLQRLDQRAREGSGVPFVQLAEHEQIALLQTLDETASTASAAAPEDRAWFASVKAQTVDAYYKSEMGQIGELEWVGHEFNDSFPGACTHGESDTHPRPRWPRSRA